MGETMLRGVNATKVLHIDKQLCAGKKIQQRQDPLFFTYSGKGKAMIFREQKRPLKDWKPVHISKVPGLDFMIGGQDSCNGDSGGPLWVRQKRKGMENGKRKLP